MFGSRGRLGAFLTVLIVYLLAFLGFFLIHFLTFRGSYLLSALWGDLTATIIVWFFGLIYKNSSLYDPYWSVAPLVIVPFWLISRGGPPAVTDLLILMVLFAWGIRLTLNWAVRWSGIRHQDWRYTMLKGKSPRLWFLTNLMGINMMPTILVFLALVPVYTALFFPGDANYTLLGLGFLTCLAAMGIQLVADRQMDSFKSRLTDKGEYIDEGIWRYSRHPNYFGEILFWWGLWIMQMAVNHAFWYTVIGPILMSLLFVFVSIPMMEKHILSTRPGYAKYQQEVTILVPWFRNAKEEKQSSQTV